MLSIGLFAMIGGVSVQTLRHYDKLGLLCPAQVDPFTNYRNYAPGQLMHLHRILALKELGLSLEQIGDVLAESLSPEQLRGMLRLKRAQIAGDLQRANQQLALIEAHIHHIEQEGQMSDKTVIIKHVDALRVASRRVYIANNEAIVLNELSDAFMTAEKWLAAKRCAILGPSLAIWSNATQGTGWDVEAAFPVGPAAKGDDQVQVVELPKAQVASLIHQGDFSTYREGFPIILNWIQRNGYTISGACREVYHQFDPARLDDVTVEIQFPVTRAAGP